MDAKTITAWIPRSRTGVALAAAAALGLAMSAPRAEAAPMTAGASAVRDAAPAAAIDAQWRDGYGPRGYRPYRPYRGYGYRPYGPRYFGGPAFAGPRCFWRPAREVFTPYGVRLIPARRVCRY